MPLSPETPITIPDGLHQVEVSVNPKHGTTLLRLPAFGVEAVHPSSRLFNDYTKKWPHMNKDGLSQEGTICIQDGRPVALVLEEGKWSFVFTSGVGPSFLPAPKWEHTAPVPYEVNPSHRLTPQRTGRGVRIRSTDVTVTVLYPGEELIDEGDPAQVLFDNLLPYLADNGVTGVEVGESWHALAHTVGTPVNKALVQVYRVECDPSLPDGVVRIISFDTSQEQETPAPQNPDPVAHLVTLATNPATGRIDAAKLAGMLKTHLNAQERKAEAIRKGIQAFGGAELGEFTVLAWVKRYLAPFNDDNEVREEVVSYLAYQGANDKIRAAVLDILRQELEELTGETVGTASQPFPASKE
jgi:hypothetical protein